MNRQQRRAAERQVRPAQRRAVAATLETADGIVEQIKTAVARQLQLHRAHDALATNDALFQSARDLRRQAQQILNSGGRQAVADELVAQAVLLESAAQTDAAPA